MSETGKSAERPQIISRGSGKRQEIALTFDDGPSPWTAEIAAILEEHDCQATFFLRGPAVVERPKDVAALVAAGHELGNHLWSHSVSTTLSRDDLRTELMRTANVIQEAGGGWPDLVRPPYLKGSEEVADAATGCGVQTIVLKSISVPDWIAATAKEIVEPVLAAVTSGDIVCLHDGISPDQPNNASRESTAGAVKQLVPALLTRGLRPVTISQLLG